MLQRSDIYLSSCWSWIIKFSGFIAEVKNILMGSGTMIGLHFLKKKKKLSPFLFLHMKIILVHCACNVMVFVSLCLELHYGKLAFSFLKICKLPNSSIFPIIVICQCRCNCSSLPVNIDLEAFGLCLHVTVHE